MKKLFFFIFLLLFLIIPVFVWAALININTASSSELEKITGVGPSIANKIIEYRTINGPFKTIEEIKNVNGIGEATFLKMKDEITVTDDVEDDNFDQQDNQQDTATSTIAIFTSGSSHTNQPFLSNYLEDSDFKIGAGRERLATVKTPIVFEASRNKIGQVENIFRWSFGDGTSALGVKVYHAYQFPGRYNVVLNATIDHLEQATARTVVLVTEPRIRISDVNATLGYVELFNESEEEQNLNNWSLRSGDNVVTYYFPLDTIIDPRSSIKIPLQFTDLNWIANDEIILAYPGGSEGDKMTATRANHEKILSLQERLKSLKQQLAEQQEKITLANSQTKKTQTSKAVENVVILEREASLIEKIKHAIFN